MLKQSGITLYILSLLPDQLGMRYVPNTISTANERGNRAEIYRYSRQLVFRREERTR